MKNLKIMHLNTRSLYPKVDDIECILRSISVKFDFLCFSETWLNESTSKLVDFEGYKSYHVMRENGMRGGGVSVFVCDYFQCKVLDHVSVCSEEIECLFVLVSTRGKRIVVGVVYRPPSANDSIFLERFGSILQSLSNVNSDSIHITGDFNYNLLNLNSDANCLNFASFEPIYNWVQN